MGLVALTVRLSGNGGISPPDPNNGNKTPENGYTATVNMQVNVQDRDTTCLASQYIDFPVGNIQVDNQDTSFQTISWGYSPYGKHRACT